MFDKRDVVFTCHVTGAKEKELDKFEQLREKFGYSQKLKEKDGMGVGVKDKNKAGK